MWQDGFVRRVEGGTTNSLPACRALPRCEWTLSGAFLSEALGSVTCTAKSSASPRLQALENLPSSARDAPRRM